MPKGIELKDLSMDFTDKVCTHIAEMKKLLDEMEKASDEIAHAVQLLLEDVTGLRAGDACEYDGHMGHLVSWNAYNKDWLLVARKVTAMPDMIDMVTGIFKPDGKDTILFVSDLSKLKKA